MPILTIDQVQPGAVLARPIEDSMGRVLINAGEALTPQLIAVLRKRGFAEVEVHGERKPSADLASVERITKRFTSKYSMSIQGDVDVIALNKEIEERFSTVAEDDQPGQAVKRAVQTVLIGRLVRRKGLA